VLHFYHLQNYIIHCLEMSVFTFFCAGLERKASGRQGGGRTWSTNNKRNTNLTTKQIVSLRKLVSFAHAFILTQRTPLQCAIIYVFQAV